MNIDKELEGLSVEELEELYVSLGGYSDTPVSIDEFIENPEFLGGYLQGGMYEFWRNHLRNIYPSTLSSPYFLVSLRGSIGIGKTTIGCVGTAYELHKLLCLANPQKHFGLIPSTRIIFSIFNVTMSLTSDVIWDQLTQMFAASPYFSKLLGPLNSRKKDRDTLFPKRIDFSMGSRMGHSLGKAVFGSIIDEANFEIMDGQVYNTFNSLLRRMESRFVGSGDGIPGKIWIISSETDKFSVMNKVVDQYRNKDGVYVIQDSLWNVKPHKYGKERFLVYKGSEVKSPDFIHDGNRSLLIQEPENIIEVPVEHKDSFQADIVLALRDLAGIATTSSHKLIRLKEKLVSAMAVNPLFEDTITIDFDNVEDTIQSHCFVEDYLRNPLHKQVPRCIHVDIAISGDRLGLASSYVKEFKELTVKDPKTFQDVTVSIPVIVTEFGVAIEPTPGKQIPLFKIRQFVEWLSSIGYPIGCISFDGFQSADMIQLLTVAGYTTQLLSVDRTINPYINLRTKIYDGTSIIPNMKLLKDELEDLEVSSDFKKVDHTPEGSKDLADGVCGSVQSCINRADEYRLFIQSDKLNKELPSDSIKAIFGIG